VSTPDPEPQPVYLTRPPKPVSEMTEAERDADAEAVWRAATEALGRTRR
jgi:hypothetical protein